MCICMSKLFFNQIGKKNYVKSVNMEAKDNQINYIEFKAKDLQEIKRFYKDSFEWTFVDYGETYIAFSDSGLEGGFEKTENEIINGALVVLYHHDLESIKRKIVEVGGEITQDVFSFPGGRRFHFKDPSGNELAVWSER